MSIFLSANSPWFKDTFGFSEMRSFLETKNQFILSNDHKTLESKANGRKFHVGRFEVLSNMQLDQRCEQMVESLSKNKGTTDLGGLLFANTGGNVTNLIKDIENKDCVFQAASQFNCLEMIGPGVRPEDGITRYFNDRTQGPACALACPAGTLYRNYFVNGGKGQAGGNENQINTLDQIEGILKKKYWNVKNGYAMPLSNTSMAALNNRLVAEDQLSQSIHANLKIGVHWDTEVEKKSKWKKQQNTNGQNNNWVSEKDTRSEVEQNVCQVYVSACPVAYTKSTKSTDWAPFASIILNSCYESTLQVANILALERNERVKVFLTKVGGGAFGNRTMWITNAIEQALEKFKDAPLDVFVVHYGGRTPREYAALEKKIQRKLKKVEETSKKRTVTNDNNNVDMGVNNNDSNDSKMAIHETARMIRNDLNKKMNANE